MSGGPVPYDAVVIGGGFFGCELAAYLRRKRGFRKVVVLEQEARIMDRASRWNQARIHGGYHYPRDFVTAHRSRLSQPVFVENYGSAVFRDVISLYAIARRGSQMTAQTFLRRMQQVGAPIKVAPDKLATLFVPAMVEGVFEVEERVFDANGLRKLVQDKLAELEVECRLGVRVFRVDGDSNYLRVSATATGRGNLDFLSSHVFNCTYSGLNSIDGSRNVVESQLKHEIAELALLEVPEVLREVAITVMDGPFFSVLPYPPEKVHSLSHVRYTPTVSWTNQLAHPSPYDVLIQEPQDSRFERMIRDAGRFLPVLHDAKFVGKFREIKTTLVDREENDGRPILIEQSEKHKSLYSVLGGKIDNVFDMFQYFDTVNFDLEHQS